MYVSLSRSHVFMSWHESLICKRMMHWSWSWMFARVRWYIDRYHEVGGIIALTLTITRGQNGWTALMVAAYKSRDDQSYSARLLLDAGADTNAKGTVRFGRILSFRRWFCSIWIFISQIWMFLFMGISDMLACACARMFCKCTYVSIPLHVHNNWVVYFVCVVVPRS